MSMREIETPDNVIKLDDLTAVSVEVYYGEGCRSDGMSKEQFKAYVELFAMAKEALEASLHESASYWPNGGRCDCPWCNKAYSVLDKISTTP